MNKKTFIFLIGVIVVIVIVIVIVGIYFSTAKKVVDIPKPIPVAIDPTASWITDTNTELGFSFKYPADFFSANQEPKILVGDCNYNVFPESCPNINNLVIAEQVASGGDINAIKSNLSYPNYWENRSGEKTTLNNVQYCLYQTKDAAMMHCFNYYYYATVAGKQCLVVNLNTSTTNCDAYLPLEKGNTTQETNYNNCVTTNQNQPKILNQILSTFKFTK
jgi:hypothetical protein